MAAKILIIDDDPVWRQMLHRLLKAEDYDPVVAADATTALTETQRQKPDLILLDLGLPGGGGESYLHRLKSFPALMLIPIIVISGLDPVQAEATATEAGAAGYLKKPVSKEELISTIRKVLG